MYTVIGCTDCESVKIVREGVNSTICNRCQAQLFVDEVEVIYTTDDLEDAKEARSIAMAQRNGFDYLVEEMVDQEVVKDNITTEVADERLLENVRQESETTSEEVEQELNDEAGASGEMESSGTGDEDPKRRIVLDGIEFMDQPTDDDIVEFAEERGVSPDYTVDIVDELCRNGEAMRTREGHIELLD